MTDPNNKLESKLIIVDGGCTMSLTSSFETCADCKPRVTRAKTAEGGMSMETTHVCTKTYYVRSRAGEIRPIETKAFICPTLRSRAGEIRPIETKAFICPTLRTDLFSVKGLNLQGYSIVHHPES